jgi:spermidine/putrescine transport system substrate-binding protein
MNRTKINSSDPAEVQAAADYDLAHKAAVSALTYDVVPVLSSGDISAAQSFVGANLAFTATPNIKYIILAEGGTMYQENMCVLASAPNKDAAKELIQFYLRPEIAAMNLAQQFNGTPNTPENELTAEAIKVNPAINVHAKAWSVCRFLKTLVQR